MDIPLTRLAANLLLLLACLLPFIPLVVLFSAGWKRKRQQVEFLAPLLKQAGFQPVSPLRSFLERNNALFQTPDGRVVVSLLSEPYGEEGRLLHFVRFSVSVPHLDRFLICSPSLSNHIGQLLYEIYWKTTRLDALEPLGLAVRCDRSRAEALGRQLTQPAFLEMFKPLAQSRQTFFILSEYPDFFTAAFAIQPPETQRAALWLDFLRRFSRAWALPESAPRQPARSRISNTLILTLLLILMAVVLAVLFGRLSPA